MRYEELYENYGFKISISRDNPKHIFISDDDQILFIWVGYKGLIGGCKNFKVLGIDEI